MSTIGHDATAGVGHGNVDLGSSGMTRAVTGTRDEFRPDTTGSTVITAEIPAVPVHKSYGVLLPDGSVWYPGSKRRLPAPWPIRFAVWVLALVLVLMLVGYAIVSYHSSWLAPLRHTVGSAPTSPISPSHYPGSPGNTSGAGGSSTFKEISHTAGDVATKTPATETWSVPATSYTIQFSVPKGDRVYVQIKNGATTQFASTIAAGQTQREIVSASSSVQAYAGGGTISIYANNKYLGGFAAAYYVLYNFQGSSA
ncbi:MAG TPA: hypothetical protein VGS21_06125 [Acidimicrobiales bacterium]|nr:hypothetical protein [Acidimicrobiales bacterium]